MDAVYPRVRMKRLLEVWNSPKYLPEKKVLRHLKVNQAISKMVADGESDPSKRGDAVLGKILNSAQTFHGGKYSFFFGIPKKWIKKALPGEPWFCSELAAEALRELKVTEGLPAPHRTWPGHFERLKTDNAAPWLDVTDTVRQYLCSVAEGKEVGQNPRPEQEIAKTIYKFSEADFGHFKSMVVTNEEFSRLIESAKEIMDSNMNVLTQFIEWAQKKKKG